MLAPLAALLLAAAAAGPRLEASLLAGGGYDSNLNHEDQRARAVGAGFLALRATGGLALDGEATGLYAGLRLDAEQYPELQDLTTGVAGVEASLVRELGDFVAVVVAPSAFRSWSGDDARDVTGVGGRVTLRVKPSRALALRAFYGHARRFAADPVYSAERDRVGASVEWRAARELHLALGYAAERGHEVFYRPVLVASGGDGMWRMGEHTVTSFGETEEAYRALAVGHAFGPSVEIGLGGGLHLQASYELRLVESDAGDFVTQTFFTGLGVRR
jgi:hypothetical protein